MTFEEFITNTCDDLETFVGVNNMSHRVFGKWVYECQQEEIGRLKEENKKLRENVKELGAVAESWMNDYQVLKDKYEPTVLMPQEINKTSD